MRTAIYLRGSTEDQQLTLEAQRDRCSTYAKLYGLEVVGIFQDSASGKNLDRDGLRAALATDADILVAKLDRLTRRVRDLWTIVDELERRKRALRSVAEALDTASPAGRMMLTVLGAFGQMERELISVRTREALAVKRQRGERTGGVPYGWNDDGGKLVPNEREQRGLAEILRMRADGQSLVSIALDLDAMGIRSKGGKAWTHGAVAKVIRRCRGNATLGVGCNG